MIAADLTFVAETGVGPEDGVESVGQLDLSSAFPSWERGSDAPGSLIGSSPHLEQNRPNGYGRHTLGGDKAVSSFPSSTRSWERGWERAPSLSFQ
mmetsp:Transcript_33735/g.74010  ORF Transcript_33735/g.74010 Transcript_33735/m.74010 type:complete len:95 (-) Transcript_33735:2099-2383(-)